ncbi:MAG: hypothetical protein M5U19_15410 [Microthrixaceae bacterium]|nr:hypothetical protein [Microthrixaceae bacterium]
MLKPLSRSGGGTALSELFAEETSFAAREQVGDAGDSEGGDSEESEGDAGGGADPVGEAGPEPD